MDSLTYGFYLGLHVAIFLLAIEVGGRCFFWWQRLNDVAHEMSYLTLAIFLSSMGIAIWVATLIYGGILHRRISLPVGLVVDAMYLSSYAFAILALWRSEFPSLTDWRAIKCAAGRIVAAGCVTALLVHLGF